MNKEILNRVAQSPLITIDLESYYPTNRRMILDISKWLDTGLVLREKPYRELLREHNWEQYRDSFVAIKPLEDIIIPSWSYLLVAKYLTDISEKVVLGDMALLENIVFMEAISEIDFSVFKNKPVVIKGCSDKVPKAAYVAFIQQLMSVAKSIMYGEACSAVPIFKSTEDKR